MKYLLTTIVLLLGLNVYAEEKVIKPLIGSEFGVVVEVNAKFIEKRNTYHDQMRIKEPFLISIISVNGKELPDPIVMEYRYIEDETPVDFEQNKTYEFIAYETIYTRGTPKGWSNEKWKNQIPYLIIHQVVIKQKKGEQSG
jgi:hypothetical protein